MENAESSHVLGVREAWALATFLPAVGDETGALTPQYNIITAAIV